MLNATTHMFMKVNGEKIYPPHVFVVTHKGIQYFVRSKTDELDIYVGPTKLVLVMELVGATKYFL